MAKRLYLAFKRYIPERDVRIKIRLATPRFPPTGIQPSCCCMQHLKTPLPTMGTATDFWSFSQAGRKLADIHLNYETVEKYPLQIVGGGLLLTDADYRVEKMRYGKNKDLTTLHYNDKISPQYQEVLSVLHRSTSRAGSNSW